MTIQLTANSFLQMLRQSELLTASQRKAVERYVNGSQQLTAAEISEWLVRENYITVWQSEKLQQAKYRGFFLGPYRLLNKIARGGMSSIYSARHKVTDQIHALKVLPPARTDRASYLPRFLREAEMTQRLVHPNIVRVFGVFEDKDGQTPIHFMAMELLAGHDLFEIVSQSGPQPIDRAIEYIRQAARGLDFAHNNGLVHRDIKPGNLFLTNDGTIRILDLGLAQDFDSEENLTREFNDKVLGTADYLAPEQAADSHAVDARADIYSLGCTLFFLLSGRPPYIEGTLIQRLVAHQTKSPPPLSDFRDDVPEALNELLLEMMARHRDDRITSASVVEQRLIAIQHELLVTHDHQVSEKSGSETFAPDVDRPEDIHIPKSSPQDVETATASSDDSWPDELWQAMSRTMATMVDDNDSTAQADYLAQNQIAPASSQIDSSQSDDNSDDLVMPETLHADEAFDDYLKSVEELCLSSPRWVSERRAKELARFVRGLRFEQSDLEFPANKPVDAVTQQRPNRRAVPKKSPESGLSVATLATVITIVLATIAILATQI